ncbi:MAG: hypothetical protein PHS88_08510 [Candidatus Omnitrophica bacterium]|nr:hypothetical protein [Candidatus Omnitrophota bacterium]
MPTQKRCNLFQANNLAFIIFFAFLSIFWNNISSRAADENDQPNREPPKQISQQIKGESDNVNQVSIGPIPQPEQKQNVVHIEAAKPPVSVTECKDLQIQDYCEAIGAQLTDIQCEDPSGMVTFFAETQVCNKVTVNAETGIAESMGPSYTIKTPMSISTQMACSMCGRDVPLGVLKRCNLTDNPQPSDEQLMDASQCCRPIRTGSVDADGQWDAAGDQCWTCATEAPEINPVNNCMQYPDSTPIPGTVCPSNACGESSTCTVRCPAGTIAPAQPLPERPCTCCKTLTNPCEGQEVAWDGVTPTEEGQACVPIAENDRCPPGGGTYSHELKPCYCGEIATQDLKCPENLCGKKS